VHKFMLEKLGFQVEVTAKGQEAIDKTAEGYAAVLLDLGLPDVQGEEVILAIRAREQTTGEHLPIIVNSAHIDEEMLQAVRDKGADEAFIKPVRADELKRCLEMLGLLPHSF